MPTEPLTPPSQPSLVDLDDFKAAIGETTDDNDDRLQATLDAASQAVVNFTDRDFGTEAVTEDRTFQYDGSGLLEIDDASSINTVSVNGSLLSERSWAAYEDGPVAAAVYAYLLLPPLRGQSGEMGFTYNLDVYLTSPRPTIIPVTVNADWGWTPVPADVQRATIWIAQEFEQMTAEAGAAGALTSKTVAEVSESWAQDLTAAQTSLSTGLTDRAESLLAPYRRHKL